jgi:hypothetical protein
MPKSKTPPHCCNCGTPIAKVTRMIMFGGSNYRDERFDGKPKTRAEAQKYTNGVITSHRRSTGEAGGYISSINVWDGESYADEFFCTNRCAIDFARHFARTHGRRR